MFGTLRIVPGFKLKQFRRFAPKNSQSPRTMLHAPCQGKFSSNRGRGSIGAGGIEPLHRSGKVPRSRVSSEIDLVLYLCDLLVLIRPTYVGHFNTNRSLESVWRRTSEISLRGYTHGFSGSMPENPYLHFIYRVMRRRLNPKRWRSNVRGLCLLSPVKIAPRSSPDEQEHSRAQ